MYAFFLIIILVLTVLSSSFGFKSLPSNSLVCSRTFKRTNSYVKLNYKTSLDLIINSAQITETTSFLTNAEENIGGYSNLSLYFTLALYVLTLPGLYSLITRSVKPSLTRRVYDVPGPAFENPTQAKTMRQNAAEIMAYFKALNYEAITGDDTITFKGVMGRSNSQAAFLTFCTFLGLGSLGLVLSILLPDIGGKAYVITLLSPYAGLYYWNNARRIDEVIIKMEASDDEKITSIFVQGDKEDLERFSETLNLAERGKVYIKGIFDNSNAANTDFQQT